MYDTVNFCLNTNYTGFSRGSSVQDKLSCISEVYKKDGSAYLKANLGNLRVLWNGQGIFLSGSISKWFFGNNLQLLDSKGLVVAIEQLSDIFHLSFRKAKVMRLDLAGNLITDFQPLIYYPYLGDSRYYKRYVQSKSIYYNNTLRKKVFYDKIAECKSNREFMPKDFFGKNILRYELRYIKNIGNQFNCIGVSLDDLCNNDFYLSLINLWEKEYKLIRKIKEMEHPNYTFIKTKKQLYQHAVLQSIQAQGGLENVFQYLKESKVKGDLTRKQAFDIRQEYLRVSEHPVLTKNSELIVELDNKVDFLCNMLRENSLDF